MRDLPDLKKSKICIIYVYYERKNERKNQTNLSYFIKYGLDETKWLNLDITTIIVINGMHCDVGIPSKKNIHVLHEDNCSDFEGWFNGITYIQQKLNACIYKHFDYLCLINVSMCGPFIEPDVNYHWLYPFYESMVKHDAVACSPYINNVPEGPGTQPALSCSFTLIKIDADIMYLLINAPVPYRENSGNKIYNTVIGKKKDKMDAIFTGEYGLSRILLSNKYKICSLYRDNIRPLEREEFSHINNDFLKTTVFIKNVWRTLQPNIHACNPVLYDYCNEFIKRQLKQRDIFDGLKVKLNYDLIAVSKKNKKEFYINYGYAEEYIIFPKKIMNNKGIVIYAHYDLNNIISDYVMQGLKAMIYMGYDVLFYTASSSLDNIDVSILPFRVHYSKNEGVGTDWRIWLAGIIKLKLNKLKYEWVMFMNDSLLFPINGIANCMKSIKEMRTSCDFWGHWLSPEINIHLVGVPTEFKYEMIDIIGGFIKNNLPKCKTKSDYVIELEVSLANYLIKQNYKMGAVIKYTDLTNYKVVCPMLNPLLLNEWVNKKNSFAIKWKYCLSYLNDNMVSEEFNFLSRYLQYGPYAKIYNADIDGCFKEHMEMSK